MHEETISELMKALKSNRLLKPVKDTTFRKVETLLYRYADFEKAIYEKRQQIEEIKLHGIQKRSKSLVRISNNRAINNLTDAELAERKIEEIEASIDKMIEYLDLIDEALEKISNDDYFDIIRMKYFEGKTREEIAEYFNVDVATISRHKKRLINKLGIYLFPDDSMIEFFT